MARYFVYHGYVSPDNYDSSERPTYEITEFDRPSEVLAFQKEFDRGIHDECCNVIFRVVLGDEMQLVPVKTVTEYQLQ